MDFANCCIDCTLNNQCLLQEFDEVETCENYERKEE